MEIAFLASHSSWRVKGRRRIVVQTLKMVWQRAIPTALTEFDRKGKPKSALPPHRMMSPTVVPMRLKEIWITDTRLALRLTPMEEIRAVTQVPMFCPMMMGMAMP